MQDEGSTSSETVNSGGATPKLPGKKVHIVQLIAWLLTVCLVAAAWFGGRWYESREWQPKCDELEWSNDNLDERNRRLDGRNEELREENDSLETTMTQLTEDNARYSTQITEYSNQLVEYSRIAEEVNRRMGGSCDDGRSFVTPADADVSVRVSAVTGGFSSDPSEKWADYDRLYDWVVENIRYSSDSSLPYLPTIPDASHILWIDDYWRTPSETLEDETGDCEDMATLLVSMIRNYTGSRYACWVILWNSQGSGHAAVAIPVAGGNLAILDPAGKTTVGFGGHQSISTTVSEWLGRWPTESGIHVSGVVSDTECMSFASTDEFVKWANDRI